MAGEGPALLPGRDSNPNSQIQRLVCCQLHHPAPGGGQYSPDAELARGPEIDYAPRSSGTGCRMEDPVAVPVPAAAGDADAEQRHLTSLSPPAIDGAVRSAISKAIVRIHAEHYGKGATQAKTYVWDNLVVTVLRDVLTVAERTLIEVDRADTVRDVRMKFQLSLEQTFRTAVEQLTGRRVQSFMSQVDPANGLGVEVFLLEPLDGSDRPVAA